MGAASLQNGSEVLYYAYRQARPYWVSSDIKMLEWTCYTEYGLPSGHSMLAIVLLEFLCRLAIRSFPTKLIRIQGILYFFIFLVYLGVVLSRVILGMHSFNEVMMGAIMGIYSILFYYTIAEKLMLRYLAELATTDNKK